MVSTTGENEKQLLAATVRERLIGKKQSVLYRELLDEKIPTFLKNYLQNTVKKLVHTEEPVQLKHSKRYDYDYGEINKLKTSLINAIEEATIFPRDELADIINRTVILQFDLLVRPNITLFNIFYKNKADRNKKEILHVLQGLEDSRIFIISLIKKIADFDQYHIVEEDFRKIIDETEKEIYGNNFLDAFISDVKIFSQFLGMIQGYDNQKIKVAFVNLLLKERNLDKYAAAFSSLDNEKIKIPDIVTNIQEFIKKEKQATQQTEVDDIDKFIMKSFSQVEIDDNGFDEELVKLQADSRGNTNLSQTEFTKNKKDDDKKKQNRVTKITNINQDPYDLIIKRSKIEEQPDVPLIPLKKMIDEKNEKFIVKKVFDNKKNEYYKFIDNLDIIESWKEAKETIDKELFLRAIKPFSKEALRLGDLVFNRYFPKKQH